MSSIYALYKNSEICGFANNKEDAMEWLTDQEESYNLDPDHTFIFEYPDSNTVVVHSKSRWYIPSYYKYEDTYTVREVTSQF